MWWNSSVVAMQTVGSAVLILLELSSFPQKFAGSLLKCRYRCGSHSLVITSILPSVVTVDSIAEARN